MGDTHAVDVLLGICLARDISRTLRSPLPGVVSSFMLMQGYDSSRRKAWELFAGCAELSAAFGREGSWNVLRPIDVVFGGQHNVLEDAAHHMILTVLQGDWIELLHEGPPCSTCS